MSLTVKLIICIILCLGLGIGSGYFAGSADTGWYQTLNKPFFQPPPWLFGPAWTLLYTLMGIALARVWHSEAAGSAAAMKLFGFQLFLNLIWSPVFFKMHETVYALGIIIALLILVVVTIKHFSKIDKTAGLLLYPYLLWLCFATVLNASIVYLN